MEEIKLEIETQVLIEIAVYIARLLNIWSLDKALIIYWSADCAPCNWKRRFFFCVWYHHCIAYRATRNYSFDVRSWGVE